MPLLKANTGLGWVLAQDGYLIAVNDWNDQSILEDLFPIPDNTDVRQPLIQIVIAADQFHDVSGRKSDLKTFKNRTFRNTMLPQERQSPLVLFQIWVAERNVSFQYRITPNTQWALFGAYVRFFAR